MDTKDITINLPMDIFGKLEERIKDTEFNSAQEYLLYVIRQLFPEEGVKDSEEELNKEEEEKVRQNLKKLGYL